MALGLSQERLRLARAGEDLPAKDTVASLPSLRRLAAMGGPGADKTDFGDEEVRSVGDGEPVPGGDNDEDTELEAAFPGEESAPAADETDYYRDVWEIR
ncbi:hypothetical protein ACIQU4_35945 [Streptomyces sp. NPDC090741]|uniref:hypothetical protein n=1 Tax=Streptomyces sp. NPDC090741 TaxID=3365967 RepID=UPI003822CEBC